MEFDLKYSTPLQLDQSISAANAGDRINQTNIYQQGRFGQLLLETHQEPMHILPQVMKAVPETQIILLLSGAMKMKIWQNGKEENYQTRPGDLFLTAANGEPYTLQWNSNQEISINTLQIYLNNAILAKTAAATSGIDPSSVLLHEVSCLRDPFLQQLTYALKREMISPDSATQLFMDSAAQLIAVHLLKHHCQVKHQIREVTGKVPEPRLREVKDYIMYNLHRNISLDELASVACVSSYHFCRQFKKSTGKSPNQYVVQERINKAKKLLSSGMTVSQTAATSGYQSTSHFIKIFKRHTGFIPSQYQKLII